MHERRQSNHNGTNFYLNGQNVMSNHEKAIKVDQGVAGQASLDEIQNKPSLAHYMYDGINLMSVTNSGDTID